MLIIPWCFCCQNFQCEVINSSKSYYSEIKYIFSPWTLFCVLRYFRCSSAPKLFLPLNYTLSLHLPFKGQPPDSFSISAHCSVPYTCRMVWHWKRPLRIIWSRALVQAGSPTAGLPRTTSSQFKISKDSYSTTCLSNLCHGSVTLTENWVTVTE